jgi:phosphopantothenoylcysteine decarboxylase/phosphopantothenate--cysteine ligase
MGLKNKKILITAGPTWVAIDRVRVISNTASGETGIMIAEALVNQGAKVTLILGPVGACCINRKIKVIPFKFFDELKKITQRQILTEDFDAIIHSAAVSDYKPKGNLGRKIASGKPVLRIDLVPTDKIINRFKKADQGTFLVGFKFEPDAAKYKLIKESRALMKQSWADLVVANTVGPRGYKAFIVGTNKVYGSASRKNELCKKLITAIAEGIC